MKKRLPTAEERRLWRESNRFTTVKEAGADSGDSDLSVSGALGTPSPRGGRMGWGLDEASASPTPPPQPSPSGGGPTALSRSPAPPLVPLSSREAAKRFKAYGAVEGTLDLHGITKLDAHEKLQQFLRRAGRAGKRHVVIITGKGRGGEMGVLRKNLPDWLNGPDLRPLIAAFAEARPEKGGAGVTHVLLKRPS